MIKIFGADHEMDLNDHADLSEVLETMDELDQVYKNNSAKNSHLVSVGKDILFYAFECAIKDSNSNITELCNYIIKFWDKFSKSQQEFILKSIEKLLKNKKIEDVEIINWFENQ